MIVRFKRLIWAVTLFVTGLTIYFVLEMHTETKIPETYLGEMKQELRLNVTSYRLWDEDIKDFEAVEVIVLVLSLAKNTDRRLAIRRTWGGALANRFDCHVIFGLFGDIYDIDDEQDTEYGDIFFLGNASQFGSASNWVATKMSEWISNKFPNFNFLLEVVDTTFLNSNVLWKKIESMRTNDILLIKNEKLSGSTILYSSKALRLAEDDFRVDLSVEANIIHDFEFDLDQVPEICGELVNNVYLTYINVKSAQATFTMWWILNDERFNQCESKWSDVKFVQELLKQ